jgi:hypothetical protein
MNSSGTVVRIMIGASVVNGIKQNDKSGNATLEKSSKEQLARPASPKVLIHSCVVVLEAVIVQSRGCHPGISPLCISFSFQLTYISREQVWSKDIFTKMLTKKKNCIRGTQMQSSRGDF